MNVLVNNKLILLYFLVNVFTCCGQSVNKEAIPQKNSLIYKDSIFIVNTVKGYKDQDWDIFRNYSKMYSISNDQVQLKVERIFYNAEKNKIIAWVGEKLYNAPTIKAYSSVDSLNRLCPIGADTVINYYVLIGFRKDKSDLWKLYPLEDKQLSCFSSNRKAIAILEDYFFNKMKNIKMWSIVQSGNKKGEFTMRAYGYNLQDKDFWDKCWLWKKDTVGASGLYPFQVKSYGYSSVDKCFKCADPFILPSVKYPDSY